MVSNVTRVIKRSSQEPNQGVINTACRVDLSCGTRMHVRRCGSCHIVTIFVYGSLPGSKNEVICRACTTVQSKRLSKKRWYLQGHTLPPRSCAGDLRTRRETCMWMRVAGGQIRPHHRLRHNASAISWPHSPAEVWFCGFRGRWVTAPRQGNTVHSAPCRRESCVS